MKRYKGIGVFDSGVGGLSVASRIADFLPNEKIYYFGDTAHVPYGDKSEEQITGYVHDIIDFLKDEGIKALVMACNTSSAIVLPTLDQKKLDIPVLGVIEFASRQALHVSPEERIGVVANPVTVRSGAYIKTLKGISLNGVVIHQQACPRWVPLVEAGRLAGKDVETVVAEDLKPLIDAGIDTLILGCTHYPFLTQSIRNVVGNRINIIDPAEALALKLREILTVNDMLSDSPAPEHRFYASRDPESFRIQGSGFFRRNIEKVILAAPGKKVPTLA